LLEQLVAKSDSSALNDLVEDSNFQRLLTGIDEDFETAQKEMTKLLGSSDLNWLPTSTRTEATKDLEQAKKAEKLFAAELAKVAAEKGQQKQLLSTFDAYTLAVNALQERSAELGALSEAGVAQTASFAMAIVAGLAKLGQAKLTQNLNELEDLKKALEDARKNLTTAELQAAANLVFGVACLLIPHMTLLRQGLMPWVRSASTPSWTN
jgi:hypothetical protein